MIMQQKFPIYKKILYNNMLWYRKRHFSEDLGVWRAYFTVRSLFVLLFFTHFFLTGCTDRAGSGRFTKASELVGLENTIVDYRTVPCSGLWQLGEKEIVENSFYWLRTMVCAERLSSMQARLLSRDFSMVSWPDAFKQGILVNSSEPSLSERRAVAERVDKHSYQFPSTLRPLLQLWREQQVLRILLAEEKARYQHLQENSDYQIARLREHQVHLQYSLRETTRKLENLTDIERQLSSRKQLQNEISDRDRDIEGKSAGFAPKKITLAVEGKLENGTSESKSKVAESIGTSHADVTQTTIKSIETNAIETKQQDEQPTLVNPAQLESEQPVVLPRERLEQTTVSPVQLSSDHALDKEQ